MNKTLIGDVIEQLATLPDKSVQCCVTSPPYWGLRDYGTAGQIGLEKTPELYVEKMVAVFREVRRVLRDDGTIFVNLGDSYNAHPGQRTEHDKAGWKQISNRGSCETASRSTTGLKAKDLVGIPWRVAFALQTDGWYLRSDIIWSKPNPMPESVTDRPTKSHEYIFLLSKKERYYFDQDAVREPATESSMLRWNQDIENQIGSDRVPGKTNGNMKAVKPSGSYGHGAGRNDGDNHPSGGWCGKPMRNVRSVWEMTTQPYNDAHFAVFPEELPKRCILAGTKAGDVVLDPFAGSGTTLKVAIELGRQAIGIELNPEYAKMIERRCQTTMGLPL